MNTMRFSPRLPLVLFLALTVAVKADRPDPPAWWTDSTNSTAIIASGATPDHYALANLGQLKNAAAKARAYLNLKLVNLGGAGADIDAIVNAFTLTTDANYSPINLGQTKYVAKRFYDRLIQIGFDTKANLQARIYYSGGPTGTWLYDYPWNPGASTSDNYEPTNLGQLKMTFAFDLGVNAISDTDSDGLPDWWERAYFGTLSHSASESSPRSDGHTLLYHYEHDTVPVQDISVTISTPTESQQL